MRRLDGVPFKVFATPFGGRSDGDYPYEHEALAATRHHHRYRPGRQRRRYVEQIKDADAIMVGGRALSADVINQLERCKVIANGGVGVDRVDLDAATARGIVVTNVRTSSSTRSPTTP